MALKDAIANVVGSAKDFLTLEDAEPANAKGTSKQELSGDAIEMLKADHRKVEALFKEILDEKSSQLTSQKKNIALVVAELTLHAKIEETIVYPAVYGKTKRDTDERLEVLEAYEEHGAMKDLMKKIQRSQGRDESLKAKVRVLSEITEHHVKEEESEFFPEAIKLLGEKRLKAIGVEIMKIRARAARKTGSASKNDGRRKKTTTRVVTPRKAAVK